MVNKKGIFGRRVRDSNTKNRFFKYINKKEAKTYKKSTGQLRKRFCSYRTKI